MKYFSVPADFETTTVDKYDSLNKRYEDSKVLETYGQITVRNSFESGRSADLLPRVDFGRLAGYVEYSGRKNIGFNYTLNAPHMGNREFTGEGAQKIYDFLGSLHKAGVASVTVTLPSLIELVKASGFGFEIKASTLCQITNPNKAMNFKKLGVDRIVLEESINRDFETLKQIRQAFGDKVEIIANAVCYKDCIYRTFHYNQMSADSVRVTNEASTQYYSHRCIQKRYEDMGNIMRLSWVRPEDIKYYSEVGIRYFKLQGRQAVIRGNPLLAVESYFKESYNGNLMDLLDMFSPTSSFKVYVDNKKLDGFIKPFAEKEGFCRRNCSVCGYCGKYAEKCIDLKEARKIIELAEPFYNEYDGYRRMLRQMPACQEDSGTGGCELEMEFDL